MLLNCSVILGESILVDSWQFLGFGLIYGCFEMYIFIKKNTYVVLGLFLGEADNEQVK